MKNFFYFIFFTLKFHKIILNIISFTADSIVLFKTKTRDSFK